jgi:hypothetical protein
VADGAEHAPGGVSGAERGGQRVVVDKVHRRAVAAG